MPKPYPVIKGGLKSVFNIAKSAVTGATLRVSPDTMSERRALCMGCPKLIQKTKQCDVCKCFILLKTQLAEESCPEGRWHKVKV